MWDNHKKTHLVYESKIQIGMHQLNMLRHAAYIIIVQQSQDLFHIIYLSIRVGV